MKSNTPRSQGPSIWTGIWLVPALAAFGPFFSVMSLPSNGMSLIGAFMTSGALFVLFVQVCRQAKELQALRKSDPQ
jgi:hypothetical protein